MSEPLIGAVALAVLGICGSYYVDQNATWKEATSYIFPSLRGGIILGAIAGYAWNWTIANEKKTSSPSPLSSSPSWVCANCGTSNTMFDKSRCAKCGALKTDE